MILDTNALSAVADNQPAAVRIFSEARSIELPVIVLGEYRFGIAHSRRRSEYEKWLDELIAATRVLPVEAETSAHYARIRAELKKAGQPIPSNDLWIAALARQHRLPLMTLDRHFDAVQGLKRMGW
ncbi:MAG TPA: type II toxin-antitoxin system VapC family toxin [Acidobacteriaceae bacterium]|nr:type II toxin-antitoxin system VapC family toxin [Acidobacteriaceae bacterium]